MSQKINIIEFKGLSNSGKTEIISSLIKYLKKINKVVYATKRIHMENFTIDQPGKNTYEMTQSGSDITCANALDETSFISKFNLELNSIINIIMTIHKEGLKINSLSDDAPNFKEVYILCEGYFDGSYPLILTLGKIKDIRPLFEKIIKKSNWKQIIDSIIAISGSFLHTEQNEEKFKILKRNIINEVNQLINKIENDKHQGMNIEKVKNKNNFNSSDKSNRTVNTNALKYFIKKLQDVPISNLNFTPQNFLKILSESSRKPIG